MRAGRHTLICAPTGSGKTLAAFYAAIDSLIQRGVNGQLSAGVQVLYISPLKALSNDIHKNLELPLDGIPKGILFPLTRDDLVEEAAPDDWDVDALFELFANAYPYRDLGREEFDTIVEMLAVGYASRRGRRGTLLHYDAINNRLRARRGANLIALTNGGAIPDMFDYQVVLDPEDVVVGSLNEDFALEALPGDVFVLGTHAWQLLRIDGLKVRVRDAHGNFQSPCLDRAGV